MSDAPDRPARLTLATLNLYHWAAPGIGWYRPGRGHDEAGWAAKRLWLASMLAEMDADLVAFQEVVSIDVLKADCAAAGYPHFATVADPHFRETEGALENEAGARYYNRPVQAVASRWPMRAAEVKPDHAVSRTLGLSSDRAFRRPAVRAEAEAPGIGPVVVYGCHLKSPGVAVEDALMAGADQPPAEAEARARWTLEALSRAHAAAATQRLFEASQLFHAAAADIAADPRRPVAIMGDLNDTPDSPALLALTPLRAFERDGGAEPEDAAAAEHAVFAAALERFRLRDAYRLAPRDVSGDARPPTHRDGASGAAIDFILVSAALQPGAGDARAGRVAWRAHDRHFSRLDPVASSDHAGVSARFEFSAV